MTELKGCPFCGNEKLSLIFTRVDDFSFKRGIEPRLLKVKCTECGRSIEESSDMDEPVDIRWNRRYERNTES